MSKLCTSFVMLACLSFALPAAAQQFPDQERCDIQQGTAAAPKARIVSSTTVAPPIFIGVTEPLALPEEESAWLVQIVTRGGFGGRGRGDLIVRSDGRLVCEGLTRPCPDITDSAALAALGDKVLAADLTKWRDFGLGFCSDCYATMLVVYRRVEGRIERATAFWSDTTAGEVAPAVRTIYEGAAAVAADQ
ncbi:MAG TPA: hypothetical protein VEY09_00725 [Pyrinomonadaceae bacterium]|nr:hypothetical protein [Pyrinomonadaceae bacterium]